MGNVEDHVDMYGSGDMEDEVGMMMIFLMFLLLLGVVVGVGMNVSLRNVKCVNM